MAVTWGWRAAFVAAFAALGSAVMCLVEGDGLAAVLAALVAASVGAVWIGCELAAARLMLRQARAEVRAERVRALRQPRTARPVPVAAPWDTAPLPTVEDLRASSLYRPDGGPTFFERHGHRPDEPCSPACPGNPARPR